MNTSIDTGEAEVADPILSKPLGAGDIRNDPDVLLEVESLLRTYGPATVAQLMDGQAARLRHHGRPGRLFDPSWMRSAVRDLIRLDLAEEWPARRKGAKAYDYVTRPLSIMRALRAGDIAEAVRVANERRARSAARMGM